jgi:hypothetical protein
MKKTIVSGLVFGGLLILSLFTLHKSFAQAPGGAPDMDHPPQELIDACKDKAEGDACNVNTPMGQKTGQCTTKNDQLLCIPSDMKERMNQ